MLLIVLDFIMLHDVLLVVLDLCRSLDFIMSYVACVVLNLSYSSLFMFRIDVTNVYSLECSSRNVSAVRHLWLPPVSG